MILITIPGFRLGIGDITQHGGAPGVLSPGPCTTAIFGNTMGLPIILITITGPLCTVCLRPIIFTSTAELFRVHTGKRHLPLNRDKTFHIIFLTIAGKT